MKRYYLPAMLVILGLAFSLRLYRLDFQSIWWDEGHSLFVASQPISQIPTLPAMDVHPPAYFVLLRLWLGLAGQSEFALRYLSVGFSLLAVALLGRFAAALPVSHPRRVALLAALLAALSPMYIAYAQEVRSYALITFLGLASVFSLWRLLFAASNQASVSMSQSHLAGKLFWSLLLYIVSTAACLYTHYFTVFLLLFQNLVWVGYIAQQGPRSILRGLQPSNRLQVGIVARQVGSLPAGAVLWLVSQATIFLLFWPQLRLALRQVTGYTNPNLAPPALAEFIQRSWQAYTVGLTLDPEPARWGMGLIAAALLLGWGVRLVYERASRLVFIFLGGWLTIPLAAYFGVLQRQPSFEPRYLMLVTPALLLLLALGLVLPARVSLKNNLRLPYSVFRITYCVFHGLVFLPFLFALHSYYTNPAYFKDDSAGVAAWLAAETTANDLVYVDVPHPFHYYAERQGIPAPTRYLFVDIHTAADTLAWEARGRDRLFWVTWRGSDTDPRGVIPFLAEKAGKAAGAMDFKGYHLQWFELPPEAEFSLPQALEPVEATFGEVLGLDGAAFSPAAGGDEPAWVTLHFSLLRETEVNYKVSVRLKGENGQIAATLDRDLLNDRHVRTSAWPLNDPALNQAINIYLLPLTPETPPGLYQLEVVVYRPEPPYPSEGVTGQDSLDGLAARVGAVVVRE